MALDVTLETNVHRTTTSMVPIACPLKYNVLQELSGKMEIANPREITVKTDSTSSMGNVFPFPVNALPPQFGMVSLAFLRLQVNVPMVQPSVAIHVYPI